MRYADIVFIDNDEGREVTDKLFNVDGVVQHGATEESIAEALIYLSQWENGDEEIVTADSTPSGTRDEEFRVGSYILSANAGLGYAGLIRVISE